MPLPTASMAWPPKELADITPALSEWSAWYEGSPESLSKVYNGAAAAAAPDRARGLRRFLWWSRQPATVTERPDSLHVPIAADIARASADLLYAEPPSFQSPKGADATAARLDGYVEDGLLTALVTGAEVGAALGGRFQRVTWDPSIVEYPFLTTVDADAAWPRFRWGRLAEVTFWHVLSEPNEATVLRHLERHELAADGTGLIFHGLYQGTSSQLGRPIPLTEHPATSPLAHLIDDQGAVIEGRTKGLCVEYIPNQTPQRIWRNDPIGRHLGRSDYDGTVPLMDALDEAYSSLMRDIRLAKSRIIVPAYMLQSRGPGKGAEFDLDRSVYSPVNTPQGEDERGLAGQIVPQQFAIRVDEHLRTCDDLIARTIQTAGYSGQTFGDYGDGGQMTATEVHARERRSYSTRGRKIGYEKPALTRLVNKMLTIDTSVFKTSGLNPDVTVQFGTGVQDSPLVNAQTAQAMDAARAASTETKVRLMHPDWDEHQIDTEVILVREEQGMGPVMEPDAALPQPDSTTPASPIDAAELEEAP